MKKALLFFTLTLVFTSCIENKDVDLHRLKVLLQNTSILNETDNDEIINGFETMIDKYSNMSISERDEFLRTEEGKDFFETYFTIAIYLAGQLEFEDYTEAKPLTPSQRDKAEKLLKLYEKNPARGQDLDLTDEDIDDIGQDDN